MTYELAKQLKDAGFPIKVAFADIDLLPTKDGNSIYYRPTLSELIEACGEGIFELLRQSEWHRSMSGNIWEAAIGKIKENTPLTIKGIEDSIVKVGGSTPEESVANLWLELNKK
jgi:hypothetical protein